MLFPDWWRLTSGFATLGADSDSRAGATSMLFAPFPALPLALFMSLAVTALSAAKAADLPPPDSLPSNQNLPDPLVMMDGTKITTKEKWESKRKPELKTLFQHY